MQATKMQGAKTDVRTTEFMLDYLDNAVVGLHWVDGNGTIIWGQKRPITSRSGTPRPSTWATASPSFTPTRP
jgi:hypothetical protein